MFVPDRTRMGDVRRRGRGRGRGCWRREMRKRRGLAASQDCKVNAQDADGLGGGHGNGGVLGSRRGVGWLWVFSAARRLDWRTPLPAFCCVGQPGWLAVGSVEFRDKSGGRSRVCRCASASASASGEGLVWPVDSRLVGVGIGLPTVACGRWTVDGGLWAVGCGLWALGLLVLAVCGPSTPLDTE